MFRKDKPRGSPMCRRNHESFPSEYVLEEEEQAIRERTSGIFQLTFQRNAVWLCCNWFVTKEIPLVRKNKIKIRVRPSTGNTKYIEIYPPGRKLLRMETANPGGVIKRCPCCTAFCCVVPSERNAVARWDLCALVRKFSQERGTASLSESHGKILFGNGSGGHAGKGRGN